MPGFMPGSQSSLNGVCRLDRPPAWAMTVKVIS
jgi:hypothetical protein